MFLMEPLLISSAGVAFVGSAVNRYLEHPAPDEAVLAVIPSGRFSASLGALSLQEGVWVGYIWHVKCETGPN